MDIEFHYYMTYLISRKAGLGADDALVVAYSSQYVDDNDMILEIDRGEVTAYRNYISQTMNILKPKPKLLRIYPLFHFIPGDPMATSGWRKDGAMHWLNTTPNSRNANDVMDAALASGDLYRIGIAAHGYVDTWAHQNFIGYYDDFNSMNTTLGMVAPNIGHADAGHDPDWPALIWQDSRLLEDRVDNRARFLEAARHLLEKLCRFVDSATSEDEIERRAGELIQDLDRAIGDRDQSNDYVTERIARYRNFAESADYGDAGLPEYSEHDWFEAAINESIRGIKDRTDSKLALIDPLPDRYTWKDRANYLGSHWYRFQQAVKSHQDETWEILEATTFHGLELEAL